MSLDPDEKRNIMLEQAVLHSRIDRLEERLERDTVSLDRFRLVALSISILTAGIVIGAMLADYT